MRRRTLFGGVSIIGYGDWDISITKSTTSIPNTGGTVAISATVSRTVYWSDKTTTIEEGGPVNISISSGDFSNGVLSVGPNTSTSVKTFTITATYENITKIDTDITQAAKTVSSYGNWSVSVSANPSTGISAAGGTSTITRSASRVLTWTDNSTTTETATPTLSTNLGSISGTTLTLSSNQTTNTKTATITATYSGVSKTCTVTQNADSVSSYGAVNLTVGTIADVPASGGSRTSTGSSATLVLTWVSGRTTTVYPTVTEGTISGVASKGTTFSNRTALTNVTITATGQGGKTASKTLTPYLAGNYVTKVEEYASDSGTHFYYNGTISAAGGTKTPTGNGGAKYTFSSGSSTSSTSSSWTTNGTTTYTRTYSGTLSTGFTGLNTSTGAVTAASRATTLGDARSQKVTSKLVVKFVHSSTYSAGGTVTGAGLSQATYCTQDANNSTLTSVRIVAYLPDNTWHSTTWTSLPAGGTYIGVLGYYCYTWSSGDPSETSAGNLISGLTFTTSMAEAWMNGGLHIKSRGTTAGDARSGTVYWTYNGLKSNTLSFTQSHNNPTITDTGGVVTYNNVTAGAISNRTIPASGGSATATAGNGSLTWSKSAKTRIYKWPSGAPNTTSTLEAASSGTNTIAPSVSSYTASANSKGETASGATTVGSKGVTWSGSGGKSASGTMYVWQAANSFSSCSVACSINASSVSRLGGSITVSGNATVTWSSGSYTKTPSRLISDQNAGATISGSTITFSKNSTTLSRYAYARNYISYNGSTYYSDAKKISQKGKVGNIKFTFSYNNSNYTCTVKASKAPGSTVNWSSTGIFKDGSGGLVYDGSASGSFSSTSTISTGTWIRAKDGWMSWYGWGSKYLVQSGNENYDFVTA